MSVLINKEDFDAKHADLSSKLEAEKKALDALQEEYKKLSNAEGDNAKSLKSLEKSIAKCDKNVQSYTHQLAKMDRQGHINKMRLSELRKYIRDVNRELSNMDPNEGKWNEYNASLRYAKKRLKELSDQSRETKKSLSSWSDLGGMAAFFQKAWSLGKGILLHLAKFIGTITNFEQANVNLATILGKNVSEIGRLTASAKELGRTTEYTASQVTGLQTELAKLGFSENEIIGMQKAILGFSTAVGTNLPEAASLAGATLRMFGLTAEDSEDVMGALAVATNKSALNFSYLQTAMSIVGPVANTFGFSVKDTTALLGTLANAGFDASSAATATRNILLNLANTNGKLATALGGPVKTFPELIAGLQKLNEQGVDLATTLDLTDKRSVAAFNSFLGGANSALDLRDALENVDGELGRISAERLDTIEGSLKLLKSAWEGLILSFTGSKGLIKWFIDRATDIVSGVTHLVESWGHLTFSNIALQASILLLVPAHKAAAAAGKAAAAVKSILCFWSKENRFAIRREIVEMSKATAAQNAQRLSTIALSGAKAVLTLNFKAAALAAKTFNAALLSNPFTLILAGLTALIGGILWLTKATAASANNAKELKKAQKDLASEFIKTKQKIETEKGELEGLNKIIQESTTGSESRKKAIEQLNAKYGEYLPHLLSERDSNEAIATAIGKVNTALEDRARLRARDAALEDTQAKVIAQEISAANDIADVIAAATGKDLTSDMLIRISDIVQQYSKSVSGADGETKSLTMTIFETVESLQKMAGVSSFYFRTHKLNKVLLALSDVQREAKKTKGIITGMYGSAEATLETENPDQKQTSWKKSGGVADEDDKNWSLNRSETFLKAKAKLVKRYNSGEIKDKEEFEMKLYELEVSTLRARIAAKKETGTDLANLELELQNKTLEWKKKQDEKDKNWTLTKDESFLIAKAELTSKYNRGEIQDKETFDDELYKLEVATLTSNISARKAAGKKTEALEAQLQDKIRKHNEKTAEDGRKLIESEKKAQAKRVQDKIDLENERYEKEKKKFDGNAAALEALEQQHQRIMKELNRQAADETFKDLQTAYEIQRTQMLSQMQEEINNCDKGEAAKAAIRKEWMGKIAELDKEHLAKLVEQLKGFIEANKEALTPEQLEQYYKNLETLQGKLGEATSEVSELNRGLWQGTGDGELFGVSQGAWDRLFANLAAGKFDAQDLQAALGAVQGAANKAFEMVGKYNDLQNQKEKAELEDYKAKNEEKKEVLQRRLDAGIISQQDYDQQVQELESEKEAKEKEQAQRQAEREKTASIVQAIINTALGVTQTLAQWGLPWGLIPAGIMAAMGAAEIAMIAAQPTNAGYAEGGLVKTKRQQDGRSFEARLSPDKRGWVQSPTILVGEEGPEYVIPADGVANPTMAPFLNTIESARRRGTLRSLNLGAVYPATTAIGRANGGYVSHPEATGATTASGISVSTQQLEILLGEVLKKMDKPVPAVVSILGKGGLVEAQDTYDRMRKAGRIGG